RPQTLPLPFTVESDIRTELYCYRARYYHKVAGSNPAPATMQIEGFRDVPEALGVLESTPGQHVQVALLMKRRMLGGGRDSPRIAKPGPASFPKSRPFER